ncbi:MAG: oligosaccharide flippase family protein [Paludibacteraceae bacterium]|nr:oligosaccharide flippase family protein [Paludibacteraceae bacterium]
MGIIAKQSIQGTIVTYLGVAVGFVTTFFVLTRFLSAEEIGLARVLIDAATLFIGLAQLGTSSSIIRFYPHFKSTNATQSQSDNGFFFWTLIIPLVGFALFSIVYCACYEPLSHWFGEKSPLFVEYYYMVLPMAFFMLYQTVFETNANVRMHIVVPRAVRELITRIGLLVVYLLYAFEWLNINGFVLGLCAVYAVAMLCNMGYLFTLGNISLRPDWKFLRNNRTLVRQYLLYTGFLLISAVASVLAPTLSSFFITAQMGLNYTGIFAIATYIAVMVSIPYRSITAIASPQLSTAIKENNQRETTHLIQQVSRTILLVGSMILCLIWMNIDLIFHILPNGETYVTARYVVLLLGVSQLVIATCSITSSALNYSRFYAFSLIFSIVLTISSILLNNFLVPLFGMNGAAMSNLIAYAIYFLLIVVTVRLTLRTPTFAREHLYILFLFAAVLLLNHLWQSYLPIHNIWLSSIVRSVVLLGAAGVVAWCANLSPEVKTIVQQKLHLPSHP